MFTVPLKLTDDWRAAEQDLLESARMAMEPYLETARKHFGRLSERDGLFAISVEPHVNLNIAKADELHLIVRVATPARRKGHIEQAILRGYLDRQAARREQNPPSDELPEKAT